MRTGDGETECYLHNDLPFILLQQFSIKLAFCMTIIKSQGHKF